jgi:hypothetical protein
MTEPEPDTPAIDQQPLPAPARLAPVPDSLVAARLALHKLAEEVISPARKAATGRIGLRATSGGFGTPLFGGDRQLRVEGTSLVELGGDGEPRREPLDVDPEAAAFLAAWFAFGADGLIELRAGAGDGAEPSLIQLWPEHFDIAVELGSESGGTRATYGFSPGDEEHPEPYVYVAPWVAPEPGELWRATSFNGAELGYPALLAAGDPRDAALEFLRERFSVLTST